MKVFIFFMMLLAMSCLPPAAQAKDVPPQYLAFQIFTGGIDNQTRRQTPPPPESTLRAQVDDIRSRVFVAGPPSRKLGFVLGPLSFDVTDDQTKALIDAGFDIALKTDMAVGFHIDDSMFWGRLKGLNLPGSVEWLDWSGAPNTGRRLDWSAKPLRIMPQLCLNNKAVTDAVAARALLIGQETALGLKKLHAAGKDDLFIGVIAGWETQIGRDYKTGTQLGFCALTNKGFSAQHPPADAGRARADIVRGFIADWSRGVAKGGIPADKIYSHVAFLSRAAFDLAQRLAPQKTEGTYLESVHGAPPEAAFGAAHSPGFSTYPEPGQLEQIADALKNNGSPPWISAEGTDIVPPEAAKAAVQFRRSLDMESYLGNLYGAGARAVNIFGWGVGNARNAFRQAAEGEVAIAAYHKFLRGDTLAQDRLPVPEIPSAAWTAKLQRVENGLPVYIAHNGIVKVQPLMEKLDDQSKALQFIQAEKTADQILAIIGP